MLKPAHLYRCTRNTIGEYVTVGQVYTCTSLSTDSVGMHRPTDGGGTYLPLWKIDQGYVAFEAVSPC